MNLGLLTETPTFEREDMLHFDYATQGISNDHKSGLKVGTNKIMAFDKSIINDIESIINSLNF